MKKFFQWWVVVFALVGVVDAGYLAYEHFWGDVYQCRVIPVIGPLLGSWMDCGKVLTSPYAMVGPVPLAGLGLLFYLGMLGWAMVEMNGVRVRWWPRLGLLMALSGVAVSAYLVYLQLGVLKSICLYCMVSAVNTVMILVGVTGLVGVEKNRPEEVEIE